MSRFSRIAGTRFGSSAIFGGAFFATTLPSGSLAEAAIVGAAAGASWLAVLPLLKRIIGATAGA